MPSRDEIQNAARECLGTRYGHCGRQVGKTLDCIGVAQHVANRCEISNGYDLKTYSRIPRDGLILRELQLAGLKPVERPPLPGDVGVFWIVRSKLRLQPQHLAVFVNNGGELYMVHSHSTSKKVVEVRVGEEWIVRLHTVLEFPDTEPWLH